MNIIDKENMFLANCAIHEQAGLTPVTFLDRVKHIRFVRMQHLRAFTVLPRSEADWIAIERFYALIKKGNFGPDANFTYDRPLRNQVPVDASSFFQNSWPTFGVYVPSDLFYWFYNNSLATIQKQIKLFSATAYFLRGNVPPDIAPPLAQEIGRLIEKYYSGKNADDYTQLAIMYKAAAVDYFNSQMPPFLPSPGVTFNDDVYLHTAFFRHDDWNRIVLHKITKGNKWTNIDKRRGIKPTEDEMEKLVDIPPDLINELVYDDNMDRSGPETNQETWSKWLVTYQRHALTKSHIYSLFSDDAAYGYIYVFRAGMSDRYKIGWTEEKQIDKRKASLQTGSSEPLNVVGSFPASSKKTEQTIHRLHQNKNVLGEWFELSDDEVSNLLSPDWRKQHNIF